MLTPVVFQEPYPPYNAGETAGVPDHVAERLLEAGRAVRPGEPDKLLIPKPQQGSVPQPVQCAACGEAFLPSMYEIHRCSPPTAEREGVGIYYAGFHQGRRHEGRFRRER